MPQVGGMGRWARCVAVLLSQVGGAGGCARSTAVLPHGWVGCVCAELLGPVLTALEWCQWGGDDWGRDV